MINFTKATNTDISLLFSMLVFQIIEVKVIKNIPPS